MSILDHAWGVSVAADRVWAQVSGVAPSRSSRRCFMVLQAFLDESFDEEVFVMGGYISTVQDWVSFASEWEEMLPWGALTRSGERHFKMAELAQSEGGLSRFPAFYRVIERNIKLAVSVSIRLADINLAKRRIWVNHPNFNINDVDLNGLDDPFILSCVGIMELINKHRSDISSAIPENEPIHFYFDNRSDKNKILKGWDGFVKTLRDDDLRRYGAGPRFENDREFLPLQAADLWVWWVRECCKRSLQLGGQLVELDFNNIFKQQEDGPKKMHFYLNEDTIARGLQIQTRQAVNPQLVVYNIGWRNYPSVLASFP